MLGGLEVDCRESRELMTGAVDNQLLRGESRLFHDHIELCVSCRDEYELEKLTKTYLKRKITFVDVPDDVEQAITARFSPDGNRKKKEGFISSLFGSNLFQPVLAIGTAAVIGGVSVFGNRPNIIMAKSHLGAEAAQNHICQSLVRTLNRDRSDLNSRLRLFDYESERNPR
jgi:hypothetical protein